MLKILTVIGARPQIIKASAISRAINNHFIGQIEETLVHTGQHYDQQMSEVFFEELLIPKPHFNLGVGSGNHGSQTAAMIAGLEEILVADRPDYVLVYGDTNSTLAAGIASSKLQIPLVHVEAGLRSFNKTMPEEINRVLCDHVSTFLFPPTKTGIDNLIKEGFNTHNTAPHHMDNPGVFNLGDVMYDNSLFFSELAKQKSTILEDNELEPGAFILCTVHRASNVDDRSRLKNVIKSLLCIADQGKQIVLPLHPRTQKQLELSFDGELYLKLLSHPKILMLPPLPFLDMIRLEKNTNLIMTDSGGVQKEAFFFGKPSIVFRAETEWVEIIEHGAGKLCDADLHQILEACRSFEDAPTIDPKNIYGDGNAARKILELLLTTPKANIHSS